VVPGSPRGSGGSKQRQTKSADVRSKPEQAGTVKSKQTGNNTDISGPEQTGLRTRVGDQGARVGGKRNQNFGPVIGFTYYAVTASFFWTNGQKVLMEEYDSERDIYHHNELLMDGGQRSCICIWQAQAQPTPGLLTLDRIIH